MSFGSGLTVDDFNKADSDDSLFKTNANEDEDEDEDVRNEEAALEVKSLNSLTES